ncbi:MAG TPA: DedA family protein [Rhodanobacteraceae bacterium]|nr:DedA family protein [Rhodanobacteraceae bacterium]
MLLDYLVDIFANNGYVAVFSVLLLCGFGLPLPEDITLIAGGVIAGLGHVRLEYMLAVALLGVVAGDGVMFLVGRHAGPRVLQTRWMRYLLTPRRFGKVQAYFDRYGARLMFVGRFLPGLRAPIYLTAGMSHKVPFWQFLALDGAAALISVPVWVCLGYYGAVNHEWLLLWIQRSKIALALILVVVLLLLTVYFWRRRRRLRQRLRDLRARRRRRAAPEDPEP